MPFALQLLLLVAIGVVHGTLNVIAAGGSFLTLPVLLFLGLPASIANATNRVGVLAHNLGGLTGFHRHRAIDWRWALTAAVPALAGAAFGAWAALAIPDLAFRRVLSIAMLVFTIYSAINRSRSTAPRALTSPTHPLAIAGFFIVGLYGGFIQAGVGFLVLLITSWAGMDLVRGNAVKLVVVLLLTALSLAVFAASHQVDWPRGLALGAGNLIGSQFGVRYAIWKGHDWLQRVVTVTTIVFAILLWFT